jgi:hypothetical protein
MSSSIPADFTAMMSWFTNIHSMSLRMRQLEARVEELESRLGAPVPNRFMVATTALAQQLAQQPAPTQLALTQSALTQQQQVPEAPKKAAKKERKPRREYKLADVLRQGETLYARIPLGNRLFHEFEITSSADGFASEGLTHANLNKLLVTLAKKLEEDEIRDPECKSPLNAWTVCSVQRGDKKVVLNKLTPAVTEEAGCEAEEAEEAHEEVTEEVAEEAGCEAEAEEEDEC